jgi:hypothetical protein
MTSVFISLFLSYYFAVLIAGEAGGCPGAKLAGSHNACGE